jgi:hypothetical protein
MTTQQLRAIICLTLLGAAFLSIAVPVLLISCDLGDDLTLAIFVPGLLLMSPVHNVVPALIVTVLVDAIVYCAVAYFIVCSLLRVMRTKQRP